MPRKPAPKEEGTFKYLQKDTKGIILSNVVDADRRFLSVFARKRGELHRDYFVRLPPGLAAVDLYDGGFRSPANFHGRHTRGSHGRPIGETVNRNTVRTSKWHNAHLCLIVVINRRQERNGNG